MNEDDRDMRDFVAGNKDAFEKLARRKLPYLNAWLCREMPNDGEDLAQETLMRIYEKAASYQPGTFRGWMIRIATNLLIDRKRRQGRRKYALVLIEDLREEDDTDFLEAVSHEASPFESAEKRELARLIAKALKHLPPEQSDAIRVLAMGYSFAELADMGDVPLPTMKSRVRLGREKVMQRVDRFFRVEEIDAEVCA